MPDKIIWERFNQWTKDLEPQAARVSVFEHIRDIPYAIMPQLRDPDLGPAQMLKINRGSCQPKHYLLGLFFTKLDIPVKYVTYPFRWVNLPLNYPETLKNIVQELPLAYHLACEVCIDTKWVLVDATWDIALKKANFAVNEKWDGLSDTLNAVIPQEEIFHKSARKRWDYETQKRKSYTEKEKNIYVEFIEKLNRWLEDLRRG